MVYALTVSYRGDGYSGWQRQDNALTIQQRVEEALTDLLRIKVRVHGASRTDAGVHARAQVAHLALEEEFPVRGLQHGTNRRLPEDIRIMGACRMPAGFHARKQAIAKEYRYRLIGARVLSPLDSPLAVRMPAKTDLTAIESATRSLLGRHDFTAFALSGGGHGQPFRRILSADWTRSGDRFELRIVGDGFLRGMVRSIVGTLLEVGRGRMSIGDFEGLLAGRPRTDAGPTAPARGLVLHKVSYTERWSFPPEVGGAGLVLD